MKTYCTLPAALVDEIEALLLKHRNTKYRKIGKKLRGEREGKYGECDLELIGPHEELFDPNEE